MGKFLKKIEVSLTEPIVATMRGFSDINGLLFLSGDKNKPNGNGGDNSLNNPFNDNNIILDLSNSEINKLPFKGHNYGYENNKEIRVIEFNYKRVDCEKIDHEERDEFDQKTFNGEIIKTYSDISSFKIPDNVVSGAYGLVVSDENKKPEVTEDSDFLYWVDDDFMLDLETTFPGVTTFNSETKYRLYLVPYNKEKEKFDINDAFITEYEEPNNFINSINTNNLKEGEYAIKFEFKHPINLEVFDRLNKEIVTNTLSDHLPMNYDEKLDKYFVLLYKPEEPLIDIIKTNEGKNSANFNFNTINVEDGVKTYPLNTRDAKSTLITLNGLILTEKLDYNIENNLITFIGNIKSSDIVNYVFYGDDVNNTLKSEHIEVGFITSGNIDEQGSVKYYNNITKGTHEIYVNENIKDGKTLLLTLNGTLLTKDIDFMISKTNKKRIILKGELKKGDVINVIYDTGNNTSNIINGNVIDISWRVNGVTNEGSGFFTIEISDTENFNTILDEEIVEYEDNLKMYTKQMVLNYGYGTVLYYRIKNNKEYTTIDGSVLENNRVSVPIRFEIKTDISNNY